MTSRLANLLFSATLAILYGATIPTHLPDADGPEFVVIGITGGIAHPPGYPLYCLLLRLVNSLFNNPESSFAAFGYLSAVLSGLAALVILDLMTRLGVSTISRFTAVGISFTSFSIWHVANNIEPFALNLLLCSLVLWCTAAITEPTGKFPITNDWSTAFLGLLFGFGVCNHHTQALLVPMSFFALIGQVHFSQKVFRTMLTFALGFILGLTPILYFFATNLDAPMVWGLADWTENPFSRLATHLLRREYGTFQLTAEPQSKWGFTFMLHMLTQSYLYILILPCIYMGWSNLKNLTSKKSAHAFFLKCLWINIVPIFIFFLMVKSEQNNFTDTILSRFIALPVLSICPLVALGIEIVREKFGALISWPIVVALLGLHLLINLEKCDRRLQKLPEFTLSTMLQIAKNGYFIGSSDLAWAGVPFLQVVRGEGLNVRAILDGQIQAPQDRDKYFKKWGLPYRNWKGVNDFFEFAIQNGGLIFEAPPVGNPIITRVYPFGPVYVAGKTGVPDPATLFQLNEKLYEDLLKSDLLNKDLLSTGWERYALLYFANPWAILADSLKNIRPDLAARATEYQQLLTPTGGKIEIHKVGISKLP